THVDSSSSGSLTLTLQDASGELRIFFHAPLHASRDGFAIGGTYRVVGIAGQRESARGAGDGYRVWPRDLSDVTETAPAPTDTPEPTRSPGATATPRPTPTPRMTPTPRPTPTPTPRPTHTPRPTNSVPPAGPPVVSIAEALHRPG